MKKLAFYAAVTALTLGLSPQIAAFPLSDAVIPTEQAESEAGTPVPAPSETDNLNPQGGDGKLFPQFSQGVTAAWLTRIVNQAGRSNFVFRDFLPGLYFSAELHNVKYVTPAVRIAAYYPLISTFNLMPQESKTPLHFGADFFAGLRFEWEMNRFIRVNCGPGLHLFFLSSDRWNYLDMGAAVFAGIEFLLNSRWSLLAGGFASLDNGNLGTNRRMEPFDIAYQYQIDFGFRYSTRRSDLRLSLNR